MMDLEKELEAVEEELKRLKEQNLRLQADFDNAKKRWLKEQAEFQEIANGELLGQLIEILDDFERALAAQPGHPEVLEGGPEGWSPSTGPALSLSKDSGRTSETFRSGIKMIAKRIEGLLRSYGVTPIEAVGQLFDPTRHEAVAHEPTDAVGESTVVAELRKGYLMNGRVLRHAVVKVAVKPDKTELEGGL